MFYLDDLVYVFYLAIAFFALCSLVMLPIPFLVKKLQPKPAGEKYEMNTNNNNREDQAMLS